MTEAQRLFLVEAAQPVLLAIRCGRCAYVDFPPQTYGCRRCGAHGADLAPEQIPAVGTVRTSAVVHYHADPAVAVPYTVAALSLEAGPITRVIMRDTAPLHIGDRVRGQIMVDADGTTKLRFAMEPAS